MKKVNVFTVFAVCFFVASVFANANGLRKGFNDYKIEVIENLNQGKDVEKVWNLTYNEGEKPVTVVKRHFNEGVVYVVNSEFFEVCYASSSKGFGIRALKKSWSCIPPQINEVVLNSDEMKRQKVILPNKVDDEMALGLIASYLPNLINDDYIHLLN